MIVGCGFPEAEAGDEPRPARRAARRAAADGGRHDRQPLLRLEPADDPHGVPRDPGGRGRCVRRRRGRVDLPGRRLSEGRRRAPSPADGLGRRDRERLHPDGPDRRERRRAVRRRARGDGPLCAALAGARGRGAGVRPLRPRDHAVREGGRHGGVARRRPARELDARGARRPRSRLPPRGQGDGRQLLPAERRRCRGRRHERGAGARARDLAARADHRLVRLRPRSGDHGRGADRGGPQGARARRA